MHPIRIASLLALFGVAACGERPTGTESPDDAALEGEEFEMGETRAVEPGPAELEVGEPQTLPGAQPN